MFLTTGQNSLDRYIIIILALCRQSVNFPERVDAAVVKPHV